MGTMPAERARQENGFLVFKDNRFDTSDTPGLGRPSVFDEDRLKALIHNDPCLCTRELANVMNCSRVFCGRPAFGQNCNFGS